MHKISAKILEFIEATPGLTRAKLADSIGVSRATVTKWFNDPKEPEPDYKNLVKIADFFNIDVDYFYHEMTTNGEFDDYTIIKDAHDKEHLGWFVNPATIALAQEMSARPEMKTLFDASRNLSPEDLQIVNQLVLKLSEKK